MHSLKRTAGKVNLMKDMIVILVSFIVADFVHNILEIWGMRQKVEWLRLVLDNKKHGSWPVNIDTKFKTVVLHTAIFLTSAGLAFLILKSINLSEQTLVILGIVILLAGYVYTTWKVDLFHSEIRDMPKKAKK